MRFLPVPATLKILPLAVIVNIEGRAFTHKPDAIATVYEGV